ncbi:hypothetical protein SNEBB_002040 [Seison nebaliae]|nr:hypothetical protein SNEBB_002040 [Seison nebaliae]
MGKSLSQESKPIPCELTKKQVKFLSSVTDLSDLDIIGWYRGFILENPNGYMTKKCFIDSYRRMFPQGRPDKFAKIVFNAFDTNENSVIEFEEFLVVINISHNGTVVDKLTWTFNLHDLDKNGYVDEWETFSITKAVYKLLGKQVQKHISPRDRAKEIFAKLDTDHDKKITINEFIDGFQYLQEIKDLVDKFMFLT